MRKVGYDGDQCNTNNKEGISYILVPHNFTKYVLIEWLANFSLIIIEVVYANSQTKEIRRHSRPRLIIYV